MTHGIEGQIAFKVNTTTGEKCLCLWLLNSDGSAHTKGTIVAAATGTNESVKIAPVDSDMPMAVAYEQVAASGYGWYAISGVCIVQFAAAHTATRGYTAYCSSTAGKALDSITVPGTAAVHDREIGHTMKTASGAGASTLVNLHWR